MDASSHLSVVLDLPPAQWHRSAHHTQPLDLPSFLSHVLVFLNAHIANCAENSLAVFGAFPGNSLMLYSSADPVPEHLPIDPDSYPPFVHLDHAISRRIHAHLDALDSDTSAQPSALVAAITKALCYVNRLSTTNAAKPAGTAERDLSILPDPRLLVLSVSPDLATSYIPIMNSVFSAQKLKVTIDVCQVFGPDTVFLQQAAHLTGGSYIHLERRDALLQYLIMAFLPPPSIRKVLAVPTQDKVDFRAACFCHKNIIDIGFVCSVCLSIFCQPVPVCSTCRTKFPIKTLQRLNQSRPHLPSTPNGPGASTPRSNPGTPRMPTGTNGSAVARSISTSATPQNNNAAKPTLPTLSLSPRTVLRRCQTPNAVMYTCPSLPV
ncbi:Tfb4-domain-containing protein [Macrolepiota fuliginosa MF-IS2]|uniref:General transcription and DNA repair factor IIH subunit TFB4 n=1 Tax=Macrolepiota fuliginosa MF-IS2 TaxID=1400762 RepID=A0A9P5XM51_9AGAR|nr:Tfb4-domain-containing protein [Macrolepiota fuliginosa MF-IS2]